MALNKTKLISDLTSYFNNVSNTATTSTKAQQLADIIESYVKSGGIKAGTLTSTGTGNMGLPVTSNNTTTGTIE